MFISKELSNTIVDPKAYAAWEPIEEAFRTLRRDAPLAKAQPDGFGDFWVVTRYEDVRTVEKQNELFHSGDRSPTLLPLKAEDLFRQMTGGSPHLIRSLVQMDNPDHFNHRILTQSWFMPQNLKKLEDRIRQIARSFVNTMLEKGGECDFARDVAFLYPLHVVMEVIGVPEADEPRMLMLTQQLFGNQDSEVNRDGLKDVSPEAMAKSLGEVVKDFHEYFSAISEDRRKNPRNDLATIIANGQVGGEPIKFFEAMSYYIIAATAGHDTTSASTASAGWCLAEYPDQFAKVKADPSLIPGLVEESIRWETPVKHFMRTATAATELAGQAIAKDDYVMLAYQSANRDEDIFDDPYAFKAERTPNKQIAFGYGPHICLGQHLARMEMRILWEELLPRLKSLELNGTPRRLEATFVSGPKSVPIRFKAA
ncbi:MAG: cytochrome P450 [Hyphomonadaceae bacterium]|mgnify:CR=1 FL=1|nr:cytochrome P450 [Hyphomonadaceae bacterium]GIK50142.1 MAG: cytochrome P450 [Alphaproteobacteria bacterium]